MYSIATCGSKRRINRIKGNFIEREDCLPQKQTILPQTSTNIISTPLRMTLITIYQQDRPTSGTEVTLRKTNFVVICSSGLNGPTCNRHFHRQPHNHVLTNRGSEGERMVSPSTSIKFHGLKNSTEPHSHLTSV